MCNFTFVFFYSCISQYTSYFQTDKWKLASRAAVITINGSSGGAMYGIFHSYVLNRKTKGKLNIPILVTGLLGGLVGVTAICAICRPWEALVIGLIGGIVAVAGKSILCDGIFAQTRFSYDCEQYHRILQLKNVWLVAGRRSVGNYSMSIRYKCRCRKLIKKLSLGCSDQGEELGGSNTTVCARKL